MATLSRNFWPCLEAIIDSINKRQKITYGELAAKLGLKLAQQEWHTVLNPIAGKCKTELGSDYDLTWNVVYAHGPAKGLGHYFSNDDKPPGSKKLNPKDAKQVAEYQRILREIYRYSYELTRIDGKDTLTKVPRT